MNTLSPHLEGNARFSKIVIPGSANNLSWHFASQSWIFNIARS